MSIETANRLYRFTFVLILAIAVAAAFVALIRSFVIDIALAAIFAGLLHPLFEKWLPALGGRRGAAAGCVLLLTVVIVIVPLGLIMALVGPEAAEMSQQGVSFLRGAIAHPQSVIGSLPPGLVGHQTAQMLNARAGAAVNSLSQLLSQWALSAAGDGVRLFFDLFVIAFALPYFLDRGPALVARIVERIPVSRGEAQAIAKKTLAITSSTLKGIVVVGIAQGVLIGTGFAVAGIGHPVFWGTIAGVASSVPGFGSGLVWAPGALYLLLTGHVAAGAGLAVWGLASVLIGDDGLRAHVVGRGASMPPFLVFISTLGGLTTLGPAGLLIGPVLAGLLIGVLDLYYAVLRSSGLLNGSAQAVPAQPDNDWSASALQTRS
jgi:predicted PurR-regulated permease PerM